MTKIPLEAGPWRMLRRALHAGEAGIDFDAIRNHYRRHVDLAAIAHLVEWGLLECISEYRWRITALGREAADEGERILL